VREIDRRRAPRRAAIVIAIYGIFLAGIWLLSIVNP
jgi:hypothetical protein